MNEILRYQISQHPKPLENRMRLFNRMLRKGEISNLRSKRVDSGLDGRVEFSFEYRLTPLFYLNMLSNN